MMLPRHAFSLALTGYGGMVATIKQDKDVQHAIKIAWMGKLPSSLLSPS